MSLSSRLTHTFKRLGTPLLGATLVLSMSTVAKADDSSLVIRGSDGWLFPGWGSLTAVDAKGIDNSTALIKEARTELNKKGIQLQVVVLPDKTLFYQDKLPADKKLSPEVKQRYQLIMSKLKGAGISTFDDFALLNQLRNSGTDVFYRTDQHWTQPAADATAVASAGKMTTVTSMGIMLPVASSGAILMPWVIGKVAESAGLAVGMATNIVPCVGLIIFAILVSRMREE